MSLPPLLTKGKLVSDTEDLSNEVPIDYIINWFRKRQHLSGMENRVLILKSETASGKSTIIPPTIYRRLVRGTDGGGVICTQPRVMTAQENLNEMLKFNSDGALKLGDTVGWSTGPSKIPPIKKASFLSATIGTLTAQLNELTDSELAAKYKYILIDETHERDLETDMTIYMLKNFLKRYVYKVDCPFVVLMSATFDPEPLLKYFGLSPRTNFIWCKGETFGRDKNWARSTSTNYMTDVIEKVREICMLEKDDDPKKSDILIFTIPTDYTDLEKQLFKLNDELTTAGYPAFSLSYVNRQVVQEKKAMYKKVMGIIPTSEQTVTIKQLKYTPNRKVILGNVVVETGLTLDNLKYVIDTGFHLAVEYSPQFDCSYLIRTYAPQSRINQRIGRAGRKFPGIFHALYTFETFNSLPINQLPAILTEDVSRIFLRLMKVTGEPFDIRNIDMIDPPPPAMLHAAMNKFYRLGYITEGCQQITELGHHYMKVERFFSPEDFRMFIAAYSWDVSPLDMLTMIAYATSGTLGATSGTTQQQPNWAVIYESGMPYYMKSWLKFKVLTLEPYLEGIILFTAIASVAEKAEDNFHILLSKYCTKCNLDYHKIIDFLAIRDELINESLLAGFDVYHSGATLYTADQTTFMDYVNKVKHCILDGYRQNLVTKKNGGYAVNGHPLIVPPIFEEPSVKEKYEELLRIRPDRLIYRTLTLKENRKTLVYEAKCSFVSYLF